MTGQKVTIRVTFVYSKPGGNPCPKIDSPMDITKHVGDIGVKDFDELKRRITILVEDKDYDLYFHKDASHKYTFDESVLPNGGIYGLREAIDDDDERCRKITAKKLVAIKSAAAFEKNIRGTAVKVYKRRGRSNRLRKLDGYIVDLCVVMMKEKLGRFLLLR